MKLKTILKQILIFTLLCAPTYGRLGETKDECDKRYGKPVASEGRNRVYVKNGFKIGILFAYDKATILMISHVDKTDKFNLIEITAILKSNARGRQILQITKDNIKDESFYVKNPNALFAYQMDEETIVLTDQESRLKNQEQSTSEAKKSVEGF